MPKMETRIFQIYSTGGVHSVYNGLKEYAPSWEWTLSFLKAAPVSDGFREATIKGKKLFQEGAKLFPLYMASFFENNHILER